jgi:hypothetical protein
MKSGLAPATAWLLRLIHLPVAVTATGRLFFSGTIGFSSTAWTKTRAAWGAFLWSRVTSNGATASGGATGGSWLTESCVPLSAGENHGKAGDMRV